MFPDNREIPAADINEVLEALSYWWNGMFLCHVAEDLLLNLISPDLMTSETSTAPYDQRKISELSRIIGGMRRTFMKGMGVTLRTSFTTTDGTKSKYDAIIIGK